MALEFDKMTGDTSVAKEYLSEEKTLAYIINNYEKEYKNYIYFNGDKFQDYKPSPTTIQRDPSKMKELATMLANKIHLFASLEYHFRNIPMDSTIAQLSLVVKYVLSLGSPQVSDTNTIYMDKNMPILRFGQVMSKLYMGTEAFFIYAYKETLAITHLLVSLCHKAGFNYVYIKLRNEEIVTKGITLFPQCTNGTLGVVCDDADIDSAVDVFITCMEMTPWSIRHILVQESVYQQFKDALHWKCNVNKQAEPQPSHSYVCAQTLCYGNKMFVIDPLSSDDSVNSPVITVQAYRTAKELLSLANKRKHLYLSLWSNNVELINEVAYDVGSTVVWVNNFANFKGPLKILDSIFPDWYAPFTSVEIVGRAKKWASLDFETRKETLREVLKYDNEKLDLIEKLDDISEESQSSVHIGKNFTCTIINNPTYIEKTTEDFPSYNACRLLLNGKAVAVPKILIFVPKLSELGVPLMEIPVSPNKPHSEWPSNYAKKVIWMNRGTIFAN